jgi:serine/threonine protein kinase
VRVPSHFYVHRLDYCHRKGVVNRDIKLENTLLQVTGIVLVSLGPVLEGRIGVSGPHLASEVDCIAAVLAKSAVSFTK